MSAKPLLAPVLLGFLLAVAGPLVAVFVLSGFDWNLLDAPHWVGLQNFAGLQFGTSVVTTAWIALLATLFQVGFGGVLGYFLSAWTKPDQNLSAVYLLPWLTAPIAIGVIWKWILSPTNGLLSNALGFRLDLLSNEFWAPVVVAAVAAWGGIGYTALIFASGLRTVQINTVDAAKVDGAGPLKTLWHIQLPQINKLVFFIVVTVTLQALAIYDVVFVLTGGGANTDVLSIHIVDTALKNFQVGAASAISLEFGALEIAVLLIEYLVYKLITRRFNE